MDLLPLPIKRKLYYTPQLDDKAIFPSTVSSPNGWSIEVIKVMFTADLNVHCPSYLTNCSSLVFFLMTGKLPTSFQYI